MPKSRMKIYLKTKLRKHNEGLRRDKHHYYKLAETAIQT
jgi:hypothetical protein